MRTPLSPTGFSLLPFLLLLVLLLLLDAPGARAGEDDVLRPTRARTPEDVEQTMRRHHIPEVRLEEAARAPQDRSVVGAITGLAGGRIGFMPLLQHHMGVEHWFVEGLTKENLRPWPGKGKRLFVRLAGKVALERQWSPFGGGTGFYGDGLPHGEVYGSGTGGVMGYHESVFRMHVDTVAWVRTRAEFETLGKEYARREGTTAEAIERGDWAGALEAHRTARALHEDLAVHDAPDLEPALQALLLLTGDAASWTDEDLETIAKPFAVEFPSALRKKRKPTLEAAAPTWPAEARERLAARLIVVWNALEYQFQKKALRKNVLRVLGGTTVEALERRITERETKIADLGARMAAHLEAHEYTEAQALWDEMAPLQAFLLTHEYGEQRTQHWLPSLERALALEAVWSDADARLQTLEQQIRDAVAAGGDLPNNSYRPRYPRELVEYFFPRLSEAEQRRIEALLIELAEALDPSEHWDGSLVAAEMLTGVGGRAAKAFLPGFLAQRRARPGWQRDYLETFAKTIRAR